MWKQLILKKKVEYNAYSVSTSHKYCKAGQNIFRHVLKLAECLLSYCATGKMKSYVGNFCNMPCCVLLKAHIPSKIRIRRTWNIEVGNIVNILHILYMIYEIFCIKVLTLKYSAYFICINEIFHIKALSWGGRVGNIVDILPIQVIHHHLSRPRRYTPFILVLSFSHLF